ncbi:protein dachsous [Caerostris extrusa]|uniref:Protein dachsous n=1 Tax=Caerostris extrusa TaxID=172846 RepID=A0AAV4WIU3_CAEEX|nr:protein dachsous [Caerostris extrusa]
MTKEHLSARTSSSCRSRCWTSTTTSPCSPSSLSFKVKEGVGVGQEVGVIQAIDEDGGENGRVMYSIVGGNLYDIFDIVRSTGSLYTIAEVDFEKASEYHLQVKAVDNSAVNPHSSVISVKIEVEDVNDCAPVFKNDPILFSIPENTPQGTLVWNFSATDLDSGVNGQVIYFLSQQSPASVFQIDRKTGALTLTEALDYEHFQEYTIVVTASDQARDTKQRLSTSVTCKIIVEDKNDNAPVFKTRSKINVLESEPVSYPVLHVIALDEDSRDNGLLSVAKSMDREEVSHYELNITASDHGRPPRASHQILHVYVEDVNDNPPRFKQRLYQANVSEAAPKGTFVLKVDALDIDLEWPVVLFYSERRCREPLHHQRSDGRDPHGISVGSRAPSLVLRDRVRAGRSLSLSPRHTAVRIDLLDVNDHAPEFGDSCYTLRVPENSDLSVIHTLVATDRDTNANAEVTYTITDGNTGNKFSIDLHTGQLSSRPLDREQVQQYRLVVSAHDQGEPPLAGMCNVTVIVLDQNDNDPQFEHSEYSATIAEDAASNTTVLVVRAQDPDDGVNSQITYSLGNETRALFRIDSATGSSLQQATEIKEVHQAIIDDFHHIL